MAGGPAHTMVPCRLFVLLARAAPVAVVIRRGPSRWVQLVRWDTDTDRFEPGQWLQARVLDRRADLSPDGSLLVYHATRHRRERFRGRQESYGWTGWTAVSRPPYFTALSLWPQWYLGLGGGLFLGPRHLRLNHEPQSAAPLAGPLPPPDFRAEPDPDAWGRPSCTVRFRRLERDGWVRVQPGVLPSAGRDRMTVRPEVWERPHPADAAVLRWSIETMHSTLSDTPGRESFELALDGGREVPIPDATWADWDQAGRLVFARAGKLFAWEDAAGRRVERELFDLNPFAPTQVPPPESARRW